MTEVSLNLLNSAAGALSVAKNKSVGQSFCYKCKSKTSKFECIDCVSAITERVFCNDCSETHSKITEFTGHIMLPLQRHVGYRNKRCEHGREQRDCVSCGGSRVCPHQRLQRSCRQCGGIVIFSLNELFIYY
jgi:hypothetical protein